MKKYLLLIILGACQSNNLEHKDLSIKEKARNIELTGVKTVSKQYGADGGDCSGLFERLEDKKTDTYLIRNKWDCGDYGFKKEVFLFDKNVLKLVTCIERAYIEESKYVCKESEYILKNDSVFINSREKNMKNFFDTIFVDIPFKISKAVDTNFTKTTLLKIKETEQRKIE